MLKIATHNSITGEAGHGLLSWLVTPFSKCQNKTLKEQLEQGTRYFDVRVKLINEIYKCAHGLWTSKLTLEEVLNILNQEKIYINITYEGIPNENFVEDVINIIANYKNITVCLINQKKPEWKTLKVCNNIKCKDYFMHLNKNNWQIILPIPWIWKKIYYNNPIFTENEFTFVDFL